ncbi:MAG TPA: prolyl oligopeptidase family serine peptidase [Kofleriaceae bacterium]|nr:prolyl oligopeptidase family serine peptidase [Kofleriaceae bacterium]
MRRVAVAIILVAACHGNAPSTPASPVAATVPAEASAVPATATAPPARPQGDHPASRRDEVVDRVHGVAIADPYRWLEDASKPEVQAWMKAQDAYARTRLAKLPGRDAIAARLREVYYFDAVGAPQHWKGRYFFARKHKDKEKTVVYWKQGEAGAEKVLLDPNAWSTDGSSGLHGWSVSHDGKYVAYNVSEHNADETTLKVIEVATGKVLADTIGGTKFGQASWTPDGRGFYYSWTPPASATLAEPDRNAHTEVRYHKLGGDPARDAVVHEATGHNDWFLQGGVSRDGHWLFSVISQGSSGATSIFYKDLRRSQREWTVLIDGVDATSYVVDWRDRFYLTTNDGAPRYHVFEVDPQRPARAAWKEIVPQQDVTIDTVDVIGGHLIVNRLRDAASEMEVRSLDGRLVRKIDLPPLGTATPMVGLADEDAAYFAYSSFTSPDVIFRTSIRTGKVSEWARISIPLDTAKLTTEQVRYRSKDGTEVTMFLIHRKDAVKNGSIPTLLTGYGGFQVSITPGFGPAYAVFVERGGLIAIPNLRGGGEFGEDWHRAGMMANKQNVFDDFLAAARYLVDSGWTSRDRLAIYGGSNGGLLVGAATVQAPELFKAVVCAVPLLDMVRYHKFGLGAAWMSEYGSADEPAQFKTLYAYSPYHHVRDGTSYPAFLMLSSDHDDRVDPMHARKFTAALQRANAGPGPVWLRIEQNAGHGGADVVKQQVDEWADTFAFVLAHIAS